MINAVATTIQSEMTIANSAQAKPAASASASQKPVPSQTPAPVDTVQISNVAQAALKESIETAAQTAKEAAGGDLQAQRLLAKEMAAEKR
jgi:hypothetical protein